ncbi:hypothetical protein SLS56_006588 [Neofusicoccum ribis]|uniref:Fungal N-terminal domain-containing protein n=1 Tax=Neofusicoccum ribis TaxID=45134 RepID=A0ABR3SRU6_9PEZI
MQVRSTTIPKLQLIEDTMDPISSFSLACNIIQLVEFSSKVVIGAKDIYRDGAKHENAELKDVTESLLRYTSALKTSPTADIYDTELNEIADKAGKVATELVTILSSLEVPKDAEHRRWKVMHVTVKSMYKRDSVRGLECQLQSLQGHLNMWMIRSTKDDTSAVSKQIANLVDMQEELGVEMNRSVDDIKRALGDIKRTITENQTTTHNDTDLSERGPVRPENASAGLFGIVKRFLSPGPQATTKPVDEEEVQGVREAQMKEDMRLWPGIYHHLSAISDEAKLVIKSQQVLRSLHDPNLARRYTAVEKEYPRHSVGYLTIHNTASRNGSSQAKELTGFPASQAPAKRPS